MKQTSSPALPGQTPTCRFIEVLAGRSGDCGGFALVTALVERVRVFTLWVPGILESIVSLVVCHANVKERLVHSAFLFFCQVQSPRISMSSWLLCSVSARGKS